MLVMQRQPGISWSDSGRMMIDDFFHVLKLSEKVEREIQKTPAAKQAKAGKR